MSTLSRRQMVFLNVVLIVVGLGLVAWGLVLAARYPVSLWGGLLNAFGTALAATGAVTLLDRLLTEQPKPPPVILEQVSPKRKSMPKWIHGLKTKATKIDVMGISLTALLKETIADKKKRMLKKILNDPEGRARFIFVHPRSPFLQQRSFEDGNHDPKVIQARQRQSIETCVRLYVIIEEMRRAAKRKDRDFEPRGSLIVKLIEACPYISYERYDYDIYWGLYTADASGMDAPIFRTNSLDNLLYEKLKTHFVTLLKGGYEDVARPRDIDDVDHNILLRVNHQGVWLNEPLATELLDPPMVARLTRSIRARQPGAGIKAP